MLAALAVASLTFAAPYLTARKKKSDSSEAAAKALKNLPLSGLTENQAILHALNRLGFGPRPGELERVRELGLENWIDRQLRPDSMDDSALATRLGRFPTLTMASAKLLDEFPPPNVAAQRAGLTIEEYRRQQQEMRAARRQAGEADDPMARFADERTPQRIIAELSMAKLTRAIYSERQLEEQMVDFWFNHFNVYAGKGADRWLLTSYERDAIRPHAMGKFKDLLLATAKSPAMLFYLDNWMSADPEAGQRIEHKRQQRLDRSRGMRNPYGWGRPGYGPFGRRAPRYPQQRIPQSQSPLRQPQAAQQRRARGLNENYGRELMELHTLGVDGGYTQQDVVEVAKCFTGWTIREPRRNPEFFFDDRLHVRGPKHVLGHKIDAGGMKDGLEVLELLARDPHTARHISLEIARHFVSDDPPATLVDRMAGTFLKTDGDIRAVLHTMIFSPEFWTPQAYRAKIKTPFELVVSAARAVGADVDVPLPLAMWTTRIGEPLYLCQPPTGYSDKADAWVNTGALLNRLNFSLMLASGRMRGTRVDIRSLFGSDAGADPHAALGRAFEVLLSGEVTPQTRETLEKRLDDPQILGARLDDPVRQVNLGMIAGLVLGSPEFQRR